jgi:hypothetical protein
MGNLVLLSYVAERLNCQQHRFGNPVRMFNKVFCIGFNKTGTSSIHQLFLELGLRSYHGYYSHFPVADPIFHQFQCFSDGDEHPFELLDRNYPGSRFIVTTRRLDDWLVSRIRHIEERRRLGATGPMRMEYDADPVAAVRRWALCRIGYHQQVQRYFSKRSSDLLVINICDGPDPLLAVQTIAAFLGINAAHDHSLPHENAREPTSSAAATHVVARRKAEVRTEVHGILDDLGLPPELWSAVFP